MSALAADANIALREEVEVVAFDHDPPGDPHGPHGLPCTIARGKPCLAVPVARTRSWSVGGVPTSSPDDIGRLEALRLAQGRAELGLVNLARDMILNALISGGSYNLFSNANAHLGVGNSTTAFDAAQTDLIGASKFRRPMEATYPQRAANVVTWRSVFATGEANFAWEEWGVFNASAAGQMLSRDVTTIGTKTASFAWQLTATQTGVLV